MKFIDRERELGALRRMSTSWHKELLVLYGRRRLGKTTLLRRWAETGDAFFFSCPIATSEEALRIFQERLAQCSADPALRQMRFPGWPEALEYAFKLARDRRMLLIFDEIPYLLRSVPGIDSMVQHLWDELDQPCCIGLAGSLISVMKESVLGAGAPLYGRATGRLELKPLMFRDAAQFFTDYTFDDQARAYAMFGGVPAYLNQAARFSSVRDAVLQLCLDVDGLFYNEPEFLVREELREPTVYFSVLHALASGRTRPNEIAQDAGIPHSGVGKYLEVLCKMAFAKRLTPLTEKNPERSTKSIYVLQDCFLRFWFRYIFPNRSVIEIGRGETLFDERIAPDIPNFMGPVYEDICRQELIREGEALLGFAPVKVGRYWDAKNEIDVVAEDPAASTVAFVECKWSRNVHVDQVIRDLRLKADRIHAYAGWNKIFRVASRSSVEQPEHIRIG
jgi:hypothetical protein